VNVLNRPFPTARWVRGFQSQSMSSKKIDGGGVRAPAPAAYGLREVRCVRPRATGWAGWAG
jgi:hypothetical protein